MAVPPARLQQLVLPLAGAIALLATAPLQQLGSDPRTVTVAGKVEKPRPAKGKSHQSGRAAKASVKRTAKRPAAPRPKPAALPAAAPNDPLLSTSWSLTKTNAAAAWRLTPGVSETVVAVLDTGVDLAHPDLQGSIVPGYDAVNGDDDATDDHGHGTLVAGVIAARANNGLGGVGVCSGCSVMPVKVIAGNGSGNSADIAAGIRWAAEHGADVVNLSFVLSGPDDGVGQAIAFAQERGLLVVAAAGNTGVADMAYPAAYPGVVSVAGTDPADARYGWSSYGGWVNVAAPGCSVSTSAGGSYAEFCGTSSATAFISGVAGLARSFVPQAASAEIVAKLAASAAPVGDFVAAGRADAGALLNALRVARPEAQPAQAPSAPATVAFRTE